MVTVRRAPERGRSEFDWLDSRHTFSFADYHDPRWMGFRELRVVNEDRVRPGRGFGTHAHRDMEIVTYVIEGVLEHRDSMGNGSIIRPGDVQRMSAGTGVTHSEFNPSTTEPVHFLQIWILPERSGMVPSYEQRRFPADEKRGMLRLIASHDGRDGSVILHQDVDLFAVVLEPGEAVTHALQHGRHAWIQVVAGRVALDGTTLAPGDGAAVSEERSITTLAREPTELLVFDLA
jgi:redox-sensitive bicupin YhaK (pirin superfamily)